MDTRVLSLAILYTLVVADMNMDKLCCGGKCDCSLISIRVSSGLVAESVVFTRSAFDLAQS
jgi:hypothetical protein